MSRKDDDYDFFDQLFARLEAGDFVNKTVNEFGKEVKDTINHSIKNQGYDGFQDIINGAMKSGSSEKPNASYHRRSDYDSRYAYLIDALESVKYDYKYRGYYRDGHQEAIKKCIGYLADRKDNYDDVLEFIEQDLETFRRKRARHHDKFIDGYVDGLTLFRDELRNSKIYMMSKVKKNLANK